jgi:hypothetical protein
MEAIELWFGWGLGDVRSRFSRNSVDKLVVDSAQALSDGSFFHGEFTPHDRGSVGYVKSF